MAKFTLELQGKVTRKELADRLRVRADQIDGTDTTRTGPLEVYGKGEAHGGVAGFQWTIRGLKE